MDSILNQNSSLALFDFSSKRANPVGAQLAAEGSLRSSGAPSGVPFTGAARLL
jgi:hypothetical protein